MKTREYDSPLDLVTPLGVMSAGASGEAGVRIGQSPQLSPSRRGGPRQAQGGRAW